MVFDTTASNTGWNNSAAKCLEKLLDQKFFYNTCCHHIYKFIIVAAYTCLFDDSSAPDDANFKYFQAELIKIDLSKDYHILEMSSEWLKEKSKLVMCELQQIIEKEKTTKKAFVRGDYRQCVENTLALLVSAPNFFYHKPGATSRAQWMGKVLYCQKMFMWSDQMSYDCEFVEKLYQINLFIALFYVPAWLKCNIGMGASINDLIFLHDILKSDCS